MDLKKFVVHGRKEYQAANTTQDWYYLAPNAEILDKKLLAIPLADGGYTSFTANEVDEFPKDAYSTCPHCDKTHLNDQLVTTIEA